MSKYKDGIVGGAAVCISLILFVASFGIREMTKTSVGAGFLPRVTAIIFATLGLVLILRQRKTNCAARAKGCAPAAKPKEKPVGMTGPLPVFLNILLFVVYLLLLEKIGFLIMTTLYMTLQMVLLTDPAKVKIGRFVVISAVVCFGAYYLFVNFFQVMLPAGILE